MEDFWQKFYFLPDFVLYTDDTAREMAFAPWGIFSGARTIIIMRGTAGRTAEPSPLGVFESRINLSVAQKLERFWPFMGRNLWLIRGYFPARRGQRYARWEGVSDIKNRVELINSVNDALSKHTSEHFSEGKYRGAQFFYAKTEYSET